MYCSGSYRTVSLYCRVLQARSLSNTVRECDRIIIVLNEFGVRNGEAYIDSVDYQAITIEQFIERIVGIMGQPDRK